MRLIAEHSLLVFLFLTGLLGGGVAWMAGRGLALGWRPLWYVIAYMLLMGLVLRFFHYSLFGGSFSFSWWPAGGTFGLPLPGRTTLHYYLVDTLVIMAAAMLGWRHTRVNQMVAQYHWLYRRTSPFTWARR